MSRFIPHRIRLGSLENQSNTVREFGRAGDVSNIDIEKTNEVSRRNGYVRRLQSQLSGPVRMLHSFGGIAGRYPRYQDGGGLIYVSGTVGTGALRETLDLDTLYPVDPADEGTGIGVGDGNAGNTETTGGEGTVTNGDGSVVQETGIQRGTDAVTDWTTQVPDADFSVTATLSALNTVDLEWSWADSNSTAFTGSVFIYRLYGSGTAVSEGDEVTSTSDLSGTYTDTVDEYSGDINYQFVWKFEGLGDVGPYDSTTIDQEFRTFSFSLPTNVDSGIEETVSVQAVHWTGANDTDYTPSGDVAITVSDAAFTVSPSTTDNTGWTGGAKDVGITIFGSGSVTITIVQLDEATSGSDSTSVYSQSYLENFSGTAGYSYAVYNTVFQIQFIGGRGDPDGQSQTSQIVEAPSTALAISGAYSASMDIVQSANQTSFFMYLVDQSDASNNMRFWVKHEGAQIFLNVTRAGDGAFGQSATGGTWADGGRFRATVTSAGALTLSYNGYELTRASGSSLSGNYWPAAGMSGNSSGLIDDYGVFVE